MRMHQCPGPDCHAIVSAGMLACRRHWYQVPVPLRDRVWSAWRGGAGAGSEAHTQAMRDAIRTMTP
jgi:hypothetical protein